ncbi:MAG: hypothetical protein P8J20_03465 [Novosphingobium sp.]|nr:hypothetical protein [Novosphingobium sp.]
MNEVAGSTAALQDDPIEHADRPEGLWLGVALALLSALPFLVAVHPQQSDYASHLARYHVMLNGADSAFLTRYYEFDWIWTGNLGVDMLMWPLGTLLGVEQAAWLIALLLPVLTGLAIISVEWALKRRVGVGSLLAFVVIWSPAMLMGFSNFTLSLALALFAFALWVRLQGWRRRALVFVPVGLMVWLCHSAGWGVLGVLVFGYEWHRKKGLGAFMAPWPLFFPFLAIASEPGISGSFDYGAGALAYKFAIWLKALADHNPTLDMLSALVLIIVILVALRARKLDGSLAWAALIVALLTLVMPRHFGGGDFADLRLVPIALMLGCMAINAQVPRWALYCVPALFLVRLGVTTLAWKDESDRLEQALVALEQVPEGARIAGAGAYFTERWGPDAFDHAPSYATVYKDALVNTHFALPGVHMLRVRGKGAGFADPSQRVAVRPGESLDLSNHPPAAKADYLWYFGENQVSKLPQGAVVLHRSPGSLLVRLANGGNAR